MSGILYASYTIIRTIHVWLYHTVCVYAYGYTIGVYAYSMYHMRMVQNMAIDTHQSVATHQVKF